MTCTVGLVDKKAGGQDCDRRKEIGYGRRAYQAADSWTPVDADGSGCSG